MSVSIDGGTGAAKASADLTRNTLFSVPVGFIAYDVDTQEPLADANWNNKSYWKNNYSSYTLDMPNVEGGQKVRVYPVVKLLNFDEMLASPYKEVTATPVVNVSESSVTLSGDGKEVVITATRNFSATSILPSIVSYDTSDIDPGSWLTFKIESQGTSPSNGKYTDKFTIKASENQWGKVRNAELKLVYENNTRNVSEEKIIKVAQEELKDYMFLGSWKATHESVVGNWSETVRFSKDGSYHYTQTSGSSTYTRTGTYTLKSYKEHSSSSEILAEAVVDLHWKSSTGGEKDEENVVLMVLEGNKLLYSNTRFDKQ